MAETLALTINGRPRSVEAEPEESLLAVLRDRLELTGAKYGCGEGRCGACTVLVNGRMTRSCVTSIGSCAGKEITTIEGLALADRLHPVQQAFLEADAMQCGYCTTGMIVATVALLNEVKQPRPEDIRRFLEGNICRCGTYARIEKAVQIAAQVMSGTTL